MVFLYYHDKKEDRDVVFNFPWVLGKLGNFNPTIIDNVKRKRNR